MRLTLAVIARGVGEDGFLEFLFCLRELRVLDEDELLGWLRLHGATIRATRCPIDDGERLDEDAFRALVLELEGTSA